MEKEEREDWAKRAKRSVDNYYATEKLRKLKESEIPPALKKAIWSDYDIKKQGIINIVDQDIVRSRIEAKKKCRQYCKDIEEKLEKGESLIIRGRSGSGKSTLGVLILKDSIRDAGAEVLYTTYSDIYLDVSTSFFTEHKEMFEDKYVTPDILMIDEIEDIYESNTKVKTHLHLLINMRIQRGKPTIITTSLNREDFIDIIGPSANRQIKNSGVFQDVEIEVQEDFRKKDSGIIIPEGHEFIIKYLIQRLERFSEEGRSKFDKKPKTIIKGMKIKEIMEDCKVSKEVR